MGLCKAISDFLLPLRVEPRYQLVLTSGSCFEDLTAFTQALLRSSQTAEATDHQDSTSEAREHCLLPNPFNSHGWWQQTAFQDWNRGLESPAEDSVCRDIMLCSLEIWKPLQCIVLKKHPKAQCSGSTSKRRRCPNTELPKSNKTLKLKKTAYLLTETMSWAQGLPRQ